MTLLPGGYRAGRTERYRGGNSFKESRPNAWAAVVGFLAGRGYSSVAIAESLGDGTTPETIRAMIVRRWCLRPAARANEPVELVVGMSGKQRKAIEARATAHGLSPPEYCRRLLVSGSMPRDRYNDIVGSTFDKAEGSI